MFNPIYGLEQRLLLHKVGLSIKKRLAPYCPAFLKIHLTVLKSLLTSYRLQIHVGGEFIHLLAVKASFPIIRF